MSLAKAYDELCKRADELLAKHNPCKWNAAEKNCARGTYGCCGGCPRLSENGCTIQSLSCKLWVCPEVAESLPDSTKQEFIRLWDVCQEKNLLTFRGTAKESVRNAKFPHAYRRSYALVSKYGDDSTHIYMNDKGE